MALFPPKQNQVQPQPVQPVFNDILDTLNPQFTMQQKVDGVLSLPFNLALHPLRTLQGVGETYNKVASIPLAVYSGHSADIPAILTGQKEYHGEDFLQEHSQTQLHGIIPAGLGFGIDLLTDPFYGVLRAPEEVTHAFNKFTIQAAAPLAPQIFKAFNVDHWLMRFAGTGSGTGQDIEVERRVKHLKDGLDSGMPASQAYDYSREAVAATPTEDVANNFKAQLTNQSAAPIISGNLDTPTVEQNANGFDSMKGSITKVQDVEKYNQGNTIASYSKLPADVANKMANDELDVLSRASKIQDDFAIHSLVNEDLQKFFDPEALFDKTANEVSSKKYAQLKTITNGLNDKFLASKAATYEDFLKMPENAGLAKSIFKFVRESTLGTFNWNATDAATDALNSIRLIDTDKTLESKNLIKSFGNYTVSDGTLLDADRNERKVTIFKAHTHYRVGSNPKFIKIGKDQVELRGIGTVFSYHDLANAQLTHTNFLESVNDYFKNFNPDSLSNDKLFLDAVKSKDSMTYKILDAFKDVIPNFNLKTGSLENISDDTNDWLEDLQWNEFNHEMKADAFESTLDALDENLDPLVRTEATKKALQYVRDMDYTYLQDTNRLNDLIGTIKFKSQHFTDPEFTNLRYAKSHIEQIEPEVVANSLVRHLQDKDLIAIKGRHAVATKDFSLPHQVNPKLISDATIPIKEVFTMFDNFVDSDLLKRLEMSADPMLDGVKSASNRLVSALGKNDGVGDAFIDFRTELKNALIEYKKDKLGKVAGKQSEFDRLLAEQQADMNNNYAPSSTIDDDDEFNLDTTQNAFHETVKTKLIDELDQFETDHIQPLFDASYGSDRRQVKRIENFVDSIAMNYITEGSAIPDKVKNLFAWKQFKAGDFIRFADATQITDFKADRFKFLKMLADMDATKWAKQSTIEETLNTPVSKASTISTPIKMAETVAESKASVADILSNAPVQTAKPVEEQVLKEVEYRTERYGIGADGLFNYVQIQNGNTKAFADNLKDVAAMEDAVSSYAQHKLSKNADDASVMKEINKIRKHVIHKLTSNDEINIDGTKFVKELLDRNFNMTYFTHKGGTPWLHDIMVRNINRANEELGAELFKIKPLEQPNPHIKNLYLDTELYQDMMPEFKAWLKSHITGSSVGYEGFKVKFPEEKLPAIDDKAKALVDSYVEVCKKSNHAFVNRMNEAGLGDQIKIDTDNFFPKTTRNLMPDDTGGEALDELINFPSVQVAKEMKLQLGLTGNFASQADQSSIFANHFFKINFPNPVKGTELRPLYTHRPDKAYQKLFSNAFSSHENLRLVHEIMLGEQAKLSNLKIIDLPDSAIADFDIVIPTRGKNGELTALRRVAPTPANITKYKHIGYLSSTTVTAETHSMFQYQKLSASSPAYNWFMTNLVGPFKRGVLQSFNFTIGNMGDMGFKELASMPFNKWPEHWQNHAIAAQGLIDHDTVIKRYATLLNGKNTKNILQDISFPQYIKDSKNYLSNGTTTDWINKLLAKEVDSNIPGHFSNVQLRTYQTADLAEQFIHTPLATSNLKATMLEEGQASNKRFDSQLASKLKSSRRSAFGNAMNYLTTENPISNMLLNYNDYLENKMRFWGWITRTGATLENPNVDKKAAFAIQEMVKFNHMHFAQMPGNQIWISAIAPFWQYPIKNAVWWGKYIAKHPMIAGNMQRLKKNMWGDQSDSFWAKLGTAPIAGGIVYNGVPGYASYSTMAMGLDSPTDVLGNRLNPIIRPFVSDNSNKYTPYSLSDRGSHNDSKIKAMLHGMNPLEGNIQAVLNWADPSRPIATQVAPSLFKQNIDTTSNSGQ